MYQLSTCGAHKLHRPTTCLSWLHTCRLLGARPAAEDDAERNGAAFEAAYDLGAQLLAAVGGAAPARLDADLATGHLMRLCRTHAGLARPPASDTGVCAPSTRSQHVQQDRHVNSTSDPNRLLTTDEATAAVELLDAVDPDK